jgi:hypothetical protein
MKKRLFLTAIAIMAAWRDVGKVFASIEGIPRGLAGTPVSARKQSLSGAAIGWSFMVVHGRGRKWAVSYR